MNNIKANVKSNYFVFIPDNAKLNIDNQKGDTPKTSYEDRKVVFRRDSIKSLKL